MTVLTRWVRGVSLNPRFLHIESLDFLLRKVAKGDRRVNERRRLGSGIKRVSALSRGRVGWEEVDALQCAVFVHSRRNIPRDTLVVIRHDDHEV